MIILINCKSINDAIDCIKLSAQVLQANCILIFQPIYNIIFKLGLLVAFLVIIAFSLTPYGLQGSYIDLSNVNTVLVASGLGGSIGGSAQVWGIDRTFGVFNAALSGGQTVLFIWVEIFMM